jgi:hypothetical protein
MISHRNREILDHLRQGDTRDVPSIEEWKTSWERKVEIWMAIVILLFGGYVLWQVFWR